MGGEEGRNLPPQSSLITKNSAKGLRKYHLKIQQPIVFGVMKPKSVKKGQQAVSQFFNLIIS